MTGWLESLNEQEINILGKLSLVRILFHIWRQSRSSMGKDGRFSFISFLFVQRQGERCEIVGACFLAPTISHLFRTPGVRPARA